MDKKQVTDLLDVVNARHGPGADLEEPLGLSGYHDHLSDPASLVAYLDYAEIPHPAGIPAPAELEAIRTLAGLGRRLGDPDDVPSADEIDAALKAYAYRLRSDGSLVAADRGWLGFAGEAARGLIALVPEHDRVRRCANPECGWLFIDESRNHSRVWCAMGTCGSRAKMSRYRSRRRGRRAGG